METLNFTQFCIKNGYPCDCDTMFQAQLLGSRGLAGRISKRSVSKQDNEFHEMQAKNMEAKRLFYNAVKDGTIIDASGDLVREYILADELDKKRKAKESEINHIKSRIQFIESLGTMSHLRNGSLKKGYKIQVDDYTKQLEELSA